MSAGLDAWDKVIVDHVAKEATKEKALREYTKWLASWFGNDGKLSQDDWQGLVTQYLAV